MAYEHAFRRFCARHKWFLILEGAAALAIAVLMVLQARTDDGLEAQRAAERWRAGEMRYAQVSAFLADGSGMQAEDVYSLREKIDSALSEASVTAERENARLWYDAYCGFGTLTFQSSRASVEASVTGIGGDFFLIHNEELEGGYYFSPESDLTDDRIVLDATAAWQLFGSFDVAGMEVRVGNRPFTVAGVVATPDNKWEKSAYGDKPRIYMSYSALKTAQDTAEITCYEAVLPDSVTGFAKSLFEKQLPTDEKHRSIVENSSRYGFGTLLTLARGLAESRIVSVPVVYPWWENAARVTEVQAAGLELAWLVLMIVPAAGLGIILVRLWRNRPLHFADIPDYYEAVTQRLSRGLDTLRAKLRTKRTQKPDSRPEPRLTLPKFGRKNKEDK